VYNAVIVIKVVTLFSALLIGTFREPALVGPDTNHCLDGHPWCDSQGDTIAANLYLFLLVGVFPWTYGPVLYACCSRSAGTSTLFHSLSISTAGACVTYFYIAGQCTGYSGWGWGNPNTAQFCLWQDYRYVNVTGNWKQGQIQLSGGFQMAMALGTACYLGLRSSPYYYHIWTYNPRFYSRIAT